VAQIGFYTPRKTVPTGWHGHIPRFPPTLADITEHSR